MSENNSESGSKDESAPEPCSSEKKSFGTIKPMTAIQIISLIAPSSPAGASNCY